MNCSFAFKKVSLIALFIFVLFLSVFFFDLTSFASPSADELPSGFEPVSGNSSYIVQGNTGTLTSVGGPSIGDFNSFNIGSAAAFNATIDTAHLAHVTGGNASEIFGAFNVNGGKLFLVNPSGVYFAPGSQVNVAGELVVSTLNVTNNDFLKGNYAFDQAGLPAFVRNSGTVNVQPGGYIALLGGAVKNDGTLTADKGSVVLSAGGKQTLSLDRSGLVAVEIQEPVNAPVYDLNGHRINDAVSNSGAIQADGGVVILSAQAAEEVFDRAVNHSGVIQARSVSEKNGVVTLRGGDEGIVSVTGVIDVSGKNAGETGGAAHVLGNKVGLFDSALIDASGDQGGGMVLVGGDYQGKNPEIRNAARTFVSPDASINADAITSGNGGKVIVWSNDQTEYYGNISARGGIESGNGGMAEVSGKGALSFHGTADLRALSGQTGTLLLDPKNITINGVPNAGGGTAANVTSVDAFNEDAAGNDTLAVKDILEAWRAAAITLQANNDITLSTTLDATDNTDGNAADRAGRTITLQAGRTITINANLKSSNAAINITANDANAQGANRDAGNAAITMADTTTINAGNGNITVILSTQGASGDITLENLTTTGDILVQNVGTTAGSDILGGGANALISADSATFEITGAGNTGGVGASGANNAIRLAVGKVGATAKDGGVYLAPTINVTIDGGDLGTSTGITTTAGNGPISVITENVAIRFVTEAITANGSGSVTLTATGNNVIQFTSGLVSSTTGDIAITAGGDIIFTFADCDASTGGAGTITITADSDNSGNGSFSIGNAGVTITTAGGAITITADGFAFELGSPGSINPGTGDVFFLTAGGDNSLGIGDEIPSVSGLDDDINDIELDNVSSTGTIFIGNASQTANIFIGNPGGEALTQGAKNFEFTTTGTLATRSNTFTTTGNVTFSADNQTLGVGLSAANVTLRPATAGRTIAVNDTTGSLSLTDAELDFITASGTLTIGRANSGAINIGSSAALTQDEPLIFSTAAAITFNGGLTTTENLTLTSPSALSLNALNVTGTLTLNASGDITDTGAIVVGGVTTITPGAANSVTLDTTGNDFATVVFTNGTNATLVDTNGIVLGAAALTGTYTITAGGAITNTGTITGTTLTAKTTLDGGANIIIDNSSNNFTTIDLSSRNTADNANAAGTLTYVDINGFDVSRIRTTGALNLTSGAAITDSGSGFVVGGLATIGAATGIAFDVVGNDFGSFIGTTSGAGNIGVVDTNGLTVTNITANNGAITVSAGGALVITNIVSTTNADANDITISTTAGGASISVVNAKTAGDVFLTVTGAVTDGNAGAINITADGLTISAGTGIGTNSAIEVDVVTLTSVTTATGGIALDLQDTNSGGITVTLANASTSGDITFTGTVGSGTRTFTSIDTNDGNITITADAGDIVLTSILSDTGVSGAHDISVTATAGDLTLGVITSDDDVTLTATTGGMSDQNVETNNITADVLTFTAEDDIGTEDDPIEFIVNSYSANFTGGGSLYTTVTEDTVVTTSSSDSVIIFSITGSILTGPIYGFNSDFPGLSNSDWFQTWMDSWDVPWLDTKPLSPPESLV